MKVAPKLIFVFKDSDGLASSISDALLPSPNSSLRRLEEPFELPLERYGIGDCSARGNLAHFIDGNGVYKVSVLIMQTHTPPTLACALNEVLAQVISDEAETVPTLLVPFVASPSEIKCETRTPGKSSKTSIYCMPVGPETSVPGAIFAKTEKTPSPLQIQHEPLACLLHFARVLKLPAIFLFGRKGVSSERGSGDELEVLVEIGELLANTTGLFFSKDKISWNPGKTIRDVEEPWRALYG
ncbi:uncharacterized protein LOC116187652 [Punica granatum]|uniref:Uncharacterized protein LOC116187652 n=1 Tax=Punica granatum TaxID=22663 RepID=A0A6P8BRG2_PUNGR|nr:uncharacterized protein LOC116187652 [Punica granatum]XP_031372374.1 uncharacterized protein LOC116187652 [Punica granatum]XP_031372375.1 uncharacterized protein LOC116187652 [Punica granatum]XP_031372376.1 uncharacterized protein LOC116187652 [Punica granatum]